MKITELKPLEKNPFKSSGDEQIKRIAKSIQEFERMMEIRRIVIDEDNNILGGNKRYFALKKLGYKEIPDAWIEKVEGLTDLYNECKLLNKALVTPIQFPSTIYAEKQVKNGGRLHHHIQRRYLYPMILKGVGKDNIAWDTYPEDYPFTNEPKRKDYGTIR